MTCRFVDRIPTVDEDQSLSKLVGWRSAFRWEAISASLAGTRCGAVATSDDVTVIGIPCQPAACSRGLQASRIPGVVNDLAGWRELPAVEANPCLNTKPLNV